MSLRFIGAVFCLGARLAAFAEDGAEGSRVIQAALRSEYRVQIGTTATAVLTAEEVAALAPVLGGGHFQIWTHRFGRDAYAAQFIGMSSDRPHLIWYKLAQLDGEVRVQRIETDEAMLAAVVAGKVDLQSAFMVAAYGALGQWESVRVSRDLSGCEILEGRAKTPLEAVETVRVRLNRDADELWIEERQLETRPRADTNGAWLGSAEDWWVEGPARWSTPRSLQKLEFLARRGSRDGKYRLALELLQLRDIRARAEAVLWLKEAKAEGLSDAAVLLQQLETGMGRLPEDRAISPHPNCLHPQEQGPKGAREVQRHEILTSRETR